jgi:hypothetical protein
MVIRPSVANLFPTPSGKTRDSQNNKFGQVRTPIPTLHQRRMQMTRKRPNINQILGSIEREHEQIQRAYAAGRHL